MAFIPHPQEIYRHFKGGLYQVVTLAQHSETGEMLVIYQALYGEYKIYARPLAMFTERIDPREYPGAKQEHRFEIQGKEPLAGRQGVFSGQKEEEPQKEESAGPGNGQAGEQPVKTGFDNPDEGLFQGREDARTEDSGLDPLLVEFLDADTYEERLKILTALHHRITHEMLTTMAVACDIEVSEGNLEERYESLRRCLLTLERYECNRLR